MDVQKIDRALGSRVENAMGWDGMRREGFGCRGWNGWNGIEKRREE